MCPYASLYIRYLSKFTSVKKSSLQPFHRNILVSVRQLTEILCVDLKISDSIATYRKRLMSSNLLGFAIASRGNYVRTNYKQVFKHVICLYYYHVLQYSI